jgi:hypothetical protein
MGQIMERMEDGTRTPSRNVEFASTCVPRFSVRIAAERTQEGKRQTARTAYQVPYRKNIEHILFIFRRSQNRKKNTRQQQHSRACTQLEH